MNIPDNDHLSRLIRIGNPAQADLYARVILNVKPRDPHALMTVAWATWFSGLPSWCHHALEQLRGAGQDPRAVGAELAVPMAELEQMLSIKTPPVVESNQSTANRYLIIKAWGYGFWSDVLQVIGGLMLAIVEHRIPIVRWGSNSLYHQEGLSNAFAQYFESPADVLAQLPREDHSIFPPKWNADNLWLNNHNKSAGPWSRISALDLLGRDEDICVLDYFVGVINLMPYIPHESSLSGMSVVGIHRHLIQQYFRIRPEILQRASDEKNRLLGDAPYLAVHIRGSDKISEFAAIEQMHGEYEGLITKHLSRMPPGSRLFLMTDDERILARYRSRYGDRVVCTECLRSNNHVGVHYAAGSDTHESALEVMTDTLIASDAERFVGNGLSNPSLIVYYLKQWHEEHVDLLGGDVFHRLNTHLYKSTTRR